MAESWSRQVEFSSLSQARVSRTEDQEAYSTDWHYAYSSVSGVFTQGFAHPNPKALHGLEESLGLIEEAYHTDASLPAGDDTVSQWQRFAQKLEAMNRTTPDEVTYRLLYLGRHGQGYHNVAQMFYGDTAWDCYYSVFDHDPHVPTVTFFDAHLTSLGRHQARMASAVWQNLILAQQIPLPQTYYCSPHSRAMQTAELTFSTLTLPRTQPFRPLVKEFLREEYGIQTCDKRPTRSYIQTNFPSFQVEASFTENDELYSPVHRESPRRLTRRVRSLLDDIFTHDESTFISMTSHGRTIEAILQVVGHPKTPLHTGGVLPVLIRVEKVPGIRIDEGEDSEAWEIKPTCEFVPTKAGKHGCTNIAEFIEGIDRALQSGTSATN